MQYHYNVLVKSFQFSAHILSFVYRKNNTQSSKKLYVLIEIFHSNGHTFEFYLQQN